MEKIRECPFCGVGEIERAYKFHPTMTGEPMYKVMCWNCHASSDSFWTEEDAIAAWNRRAERTCTIDSDGCCSECESDMVGVLAYDSPFQHYPNYCPNCGAKVVE